MRNVYRYTFNPDASWADVEVALVLAQISTESLHGETETRLDVSHAFDSEKMTCVVDAFTIAGSDFNKLFVGYLRRDLGEDGFKVERLGANPKQEPLEVAA